MRLDPERRGWFGRAINQLRSERGWSLNDASEELGIAAVTLGAYERGTRQPSINRAAEILAGYGQRLIITPIAGLPAGDPMNEEIRRGFEELRQLIQGGGTG